MVSGGDSNADLSICIVEGCIKFLQLSGNRE